jgi:replicative DNA helicase
LSFGFPNIPDREAELIGLILDNPASINEVAEQIPDYAFQNELTRAIWQEMTALAKGGTRVSIPLLRERVKADPAKYGVPDIATFLATCLDRASGDVSLSDLAEIMTDQAMQSELGRIFSDAQGKFAKGQATGEEIAASTRAKIDQLMNSVRASDSVTLAEAAQGFAHSVSDSFSSGRPLGQDWGLRPVNDCVGMIEDGDSIVLAGPSGHGKSSLLVQVMMHIAKRRPVFLIQREMQPRAIAGREVLGRTGVSNAVIESGGMQSSEVEAILHAANQLHGIPFEICYLADMRISKIRTRLQAFLHRHGDCGFCAIDTIKHVDPEDKGARSDVDKIVSAAMQLQQLAAATGVPICKVAQVKIQYFDKISATIQPHDIYGGGGLREVADTVFLVHQPALKMESLALVNKTDQERSAAIVKEWDGHAQIKCVKRRRGRPGVGRLKWEPSRTRFSDPADEQEELL